MANKRKKISKDAFLEITDRIRNSAYIVRDDILRERITQDTHKNLQDIFDTLEEMKDKDKWEIWDWPDEVV